MALHARCLITQGLTLMAGSPLDTLRLDNLFGLTREGAEFPTMIALLFMFSNLHFCNQSCTERPLSAVAQRSEFGLRLSARELLPHGLHR